MTEQAEAITELEQEVAKQYADLASLKTLNGAAANFARAVKRRLRGRK
jgi:hypothetical protein